MTIKEAIENRLQLALQPDFLEVVNESRQHNVPPGSESHFRVTITSDRFAGKRLLERHQLIYTTLETELERGIHALALHTMTPNEWFEKADKVIDSPPCLGGAGRNKFP